MKRKNSPRIPVLMEINFRDFGRMVEMLIGIRFVKRKAIRAKIPCIPGLVSGKSAAPIAPIPEM